MTDLRDVLPHFPTAPFANLLPVLEKYDVTTTDLLVLPASDISKRSHIPLLDIKRLSSALLAELHRDLGLIPAKPPPPPLPPQSQSPPLLQHARHGTPVRRPPLNIPPNFNTISTLSPSFDAALGGGIPSGYITEITGESGVGKTQLLLSLLLSVQLPPPHGLGRPALYISTEASLPTTRLAQMLEHNTMLKQIRKQQWADGTMLAADDPCLDSTQQQQRVPKPQGTGHLTWPSLDNIVSTITPDLESQDHILTYQVPVEIARRNIGLLILDSVTANYRAEFERTGRTNPQSMAARSSELVKLGALLRELARKHDMAVVVSNQVSDRIRDAPLPLSTPLSRTTRANPYQESPLANKFTARPRNVNLSADPTLSMPAPPRSGFGDDLSAPLELGPNIRDEDDDGSWGGLSSPLQFDHQQRWFSGWGDNPDAQLQPKTPSLGLVWATQIACRLALIKAPYYGPQQEAIEMWAGPSASGMGKDAKGEREYKRDEDSEPVALNTSDLGIRPHKMWRRWMKVVFAPHVAPTGQGLDGAVEFDVRIGGLVSVNAEKTKT